VRHLLSLAEVGPDNLAELVRASLDIASGRDGGARPLAGKIVGIYFRGTSTRTRTAFTAGAIRLGAGVVTYGPRDLQIETGETVQDTGRVLSGYLDALVVRTNAGAGEMQELAAQGRMAVINAMSEDEHPTQAVADLITIREAFGRLRDIHILYLGEGNNTTAALAHAVALLPQMRLTVVTPEGYGLPEDFISRMSDAAGQHGSVIEQHHRIDRVPGNVDVVYTTRWQTMGVPKADPDWEVKFRPYSVTPELMARVSKPAETIFLHDLPAVRGAEVLDEVLDGPQSLAFRQAEHKLTGAMAVLSWCVAGA